MPSTTRQALRADCGNCFGLCCVALTFAKSADFAIDKPAGEPCPNLQPDFRCGIHSKLRKAGFQGCTVYDCFGAGQKISQLAGKSWRDQPGQEMFAALPIVRQLHELLWYLADALDRPETKPIRPELAEAQQRIGARSESPGLDVDLGNERQSVNQLLLRTSELVRGNPGKKKQRRGADLMGAVLRGADLSRADLRGCYLIGADLTGADLRKADCIGADFRDTDLSDADLTDALFLTQSQANAAHGNKGTKLPSTIIWPSHWGAAAE